MKKGDKILLTALLISAALLAAVLYGRHLFPGDTGTVHAVVTVNGKPCRTIGLTEDTTLTVLGENGPATLEVSGKRVRIIEAECPEQLCLKQGWIGRPGDSIVCVPGRIVIRIEGAAVLDAVTR